MNKVLEQQIIFEKAKLPSNDSKLNTPAQIPIFSSRDFFYLFNCGDYFDVGEKDDDKWEDEPQSVDKHDVAQLATEIR